MKFELVCTSVSPPNTSGHKAILDMPLPPPLPGADGHGNPVKHPPPPAGVLKLFVTSPERQALLRELYPLEIRQKRLRYELSQTSPGAREELDQVERDIAGVLKKLSAVKEFNFERGKRYVVTVEEAK